MVCCNGGSIILVASSGKDKGYPGRGIYSASKVALRSYVRTWTNELKDRKIRANIISPGAIQTPLLDQQFASEEIKKQFTAMIPLGRPGLPEEIAAAASFLASDESSYIAGIDLPVDGGLTAV